MELRILQIQILGNIEFKSKNSITTDDKTEFICPRLLFISSLYFILLTRRKATEALIHRISNYLDLLSEMPRYCCPLKI